MENIFYLFQMRETLHVFNCRFTRFGVLRLGNFCGLPDLTSRKCAPPPDLSLSRPAHRLWLPDNRPADTSHRPREMAAYHLQDQHDQCQPQGHFLHVCSSCDRPRNESHIHGRTRPSARAQTKQNQRGSSAWSLSTRVIRPDRRDSVPLSEIE